MCRRRFPTARQSNGALRSRSQALHPGPAGGPPPIYGSIAEPELLLAHELEEPARLSLGGLSSRSQRTHRRRPPRMLRDAGTGCWRDAYRANRSAWPALFAMALYSSGVAGENSGERRPPCPSKQAASRCTRSRCRRAWPRSQIGGDQRYRNPGQRWSWRGGEAPDLISNSAVKTSALTVLRPKTRDSRSPRG
jgi:hypothetical protein